ncbi:MAG: hypothetical protein JSV26_02240 [bacterium]|nr:MAG: hypothetical protein JSV26_02240 [bacterium]
MNKGRIWKATQVSLALILMSALAACGGTGSLAGGGIGGTGRSVGVISAFGSIFVNGVEFEILPGTVIILDDNPGQESDLALGQVVRVDGQFNDDGFSGTADQVEIDSILEGPISDPVDTTNRIIMVMGQTVLYETSTYFEISGGGSLTPGQLIQGDVVEVYGLPDSSFQIVATRVEKKTGVTIPGDVLEVQGLVANLDTPSRTFNIGALSITYDPGTTIFDNGSASDLAIGRLVEVKGDDDPADGLDADRIEFEELAAGDAGDLLEIEGYISSVSSSTDFVVSGIRVDASGARFEGGTGADIAVDAEIEVEGRLEDRLGELVLVAREVEFEAEDGVEIEAFVEAVNTPAQTLTILGITVGFDGTTEFEDRSGGVDPFDAGDIDATAPTTDWLRVEASIDSSGALTATRVERDNDAADSSRVILKGPASGVPVTPGPFFIVGVNIVEGTGVEYRLGEDTPIDRATFFANLSENREVKARGSFAAGTLTADRLELDD